MRSLSSRELRLLILLLAAGFLIANYLGYEALAQKRKAAIGQQKSLRLDIARLKDLEAAKPSVDVNAQWLDARLPAFKNEDQLGTHLYNVVMSKALAADVELSKKDPRPTQKDDLVYRSIMEIEGTAPMENWVQFLHSLQDRESFRYIAHMELTPTKDQEQVRCQARVEQWWRADSEELMGQDAGAPTLPELPVTVPSSADEKKEPSSVEQTDAPEVQPAEAGADTPEPAAEPAPDAQ